MFRKLLNLPKTSLCLLRSYSNKNIIELRERGMFSEIFPNESAQEIHKLLTSSPQTVYAGFDPTASSLHVGNLLVLINLLHWQRGGHQTIALIGAATAKIGDPSGRSTERDLLSNVFIENNISGIYADIQNIFLNHEKYFFKEKTHLSPPRIIKNTEWYQRMDPVELIGGAGRYLRMGTLLSRTSVQSRLQSPNGMSFTEFSYQLFQAYDWLHLYQTYGCSFQVGGNDQMGNIMSGHELISKMHKKSVYGMTLPIITSEMGDKFGKSAGNAVWLSAAKTSPFNFFQFWMRQPDSEVEKLLKLFTFDSLDDIEDTMKSHREKPELRLPQKRLAEQITLLVHGQEGLVKAQEASDALYKGDITALAFMRAEEVAELFSGATLVDLLPSAGQTILDLAMEARCFRTKHDALRIISAGGFYVNQQRINNPSEVFNMSVHMLKNNVSIFRVGKKNYYIIKWLL